MIGISVKSNLDRVEAELRMLSTNIKDKATYRALNRALDQTATEASREIRKVYKVKHRAVLAAMKKYRAASNRHWATLVIQGARINLIEFGARAVNPWNVKGRKRRPGGGVSVHVKVAEGRKLIKGAFLTASTRNNARGGGSAGMLQVWRRAGAAREPIRNLRSISLPMAFGNRIVLAAVKKVASESFTKNFRQQIRYIGGL